MDWERQVAEWSRPPIAGSNLSTAEILALPAAQVEAFITKCWKQQYEQPSNWRGLYRRLLKLDLTYNKTVLDFGCGFGFDALSLAYNNTVGLADISLDNLQAAERILETRGFNANQRVPVSNEPPYFTCLPVDVFHCSGVLHHIPWWVDILRRMEAFLKPGGEVRLMTYTDRAWKDIVGGRLPDPDFDIREHPSFLKYVRQMDAVGCYSDWFSHEKLLYHVGDFLKVKSFDYIRQDGWYAVAILRKYDVRV